MEGLFLSQLMAHLSAPTWGGGILGRSAAHRIFARQRDVALAEQMGRRSELGLAKMLLRQLSEAQGAEPSPGRSEVAGWAEDMPEKGVEG
ncbi:MAG: rod-binding protein [Armatimonadota bacterium]|nr:rod-binding protein [Armatimonadota bacterium]